MSRKYLCALLALMLAFGAGGCSIIERQKDGEGLRAGKAFEPVPLAVPGASAGDDIKDDDDLSEPEEEGYEYPMPDPQEPIYADILRMYDGLMPIFRYFAFDGKDYDLSDLSPDDFWLLMAMIAANTASEETDQTGAISLPKERVKGYAETFFGEYFNANGMPSLQESYSAYSDPGSDIISLFAMAVETYDGKLCGCQPVGGASEAWEMIIRMRRAQNTSSDESRIDTPLSWKVYIMPWPDGEEHEFAFYLDSFERFEESAY